MVSGGICEGSGTVGKIAVINECTCEHAVWQQRHAGAARGWHPPLPPREPTPGIVSHLLLLAPSARHRVRNAGLLFFLYSLNNAFYFSVNFLKTMTQKIISSVYEFIHYLPRRFLYI